MRTSVYVIAAEDGPVKIGIGRDPFRRLKQLQIGAAAPLRIAYLQEASSYRAALEIERIAHEAAEAASLRGEWFDLTTEDAIAVVWSAAKRAGLSAEPNAPMSAEDSASAAVLPATVASLGSRRGGIIATPVPAFATSHLKFFQKEKAQDMITQRSPLCGAQIRAARAILRWSIDDLARASTETTAIIEAAEVANDMHGIPDASVCNIANAFHSHNFRFSADDGIKYFYERHVELREDMTPHLCRAARGMLGWLEDQLSEKSRVSRTAIMAYERKSGRSRLRPCNAEAVEAAFRAHGVEFLPTLRGNIAGVRLRPQGL